MTDTAPAAKFAELAWFDAVTRSAVCGICGANFTQRRLSDRFLAMARRPAGNTGRRAAIDRVIPDGFVPLYCSPCEHRVLSDDRAADLPAPFRTPALDLAYEQDERHALMEESA